MSRENAVRLFGVWCVVSVLLWVVEAYLRWPTWWAVAFTVLALAGGVAVLLTGRGPGSGDEPADPTVGREAVALTWALVGISAAQGVLSGVRGDWLPAVGWVVLAIGLALGCTRLAREGAEEP